MAESLRDRSMAAVQGDRFEDAHAAATRENRGDLIRTNVESESLRDRVAHIVRNDRFDLKDDRALARSAWGGNASHTSENTRAAESWRKDAGESYMTDVANKGNVIPMRDTARTEISAESAWAAIVASNRGDNRPQEAATSQMTMKI